MDKTTMIRQRYVPTTCSLHEDLAALLILSEIREGRDPCAGCNMDRAVCHGRPRALPGEPTDDRTRLIKHGQEDYTMQLLRHMRDEENAAEDDCSLRELLRKHEDERLKVFGLDEEICEERE